MRPKSLEYFYLKTEKLISTKVLNFPPLKMYYSPAFYSYTLNDWINADDILKMKEPNRFIPK